MSELLLIRVRLDFHINHSFSECNFLFFPLLLIVLKLLLFLLELSSEFIKFFFIFFKLNFHFKELVLFLLKFFLAAFQGIFQLFSELFIHFFLTHPCNLWIPPWEFPVILTIVRTYHNPFITKRKFNDKSNYFLIF